MRLSIGILSVLFVCESFVSLSNQIQAAEQYPVKPIICILPTDAGADGDILLRPLSQRVSALLGKPIIIVNKPGAAGNLGYREIRDAKPDGYTIGVGFTSLATNKLLGTLPYDHRAFTIIGGHAMIVPAVLASTRTKRPFKTIEEVFSFAKSNPGEVSIATSAKGYLWWFATVALQEATRLNFNIIPQSGGAGVSIAQVAGGHVDLGIMGFAPAKPQVAAGNIRVLAVFGPQRADAPNENVPCLKEVGYDVDIDSPHFVIGPPGLPPDITDKLTKAFESSANQPEYRKFLLERDIRPSFQPPDEVVKKLDGQIKLFRTILGKAGMLKD
jgi:tripartite-type tricarboxylate transporter receptor subunit TctC